MQPLSFHAKEWVHIARYGWGAVVNPDITKEEAATLTPGSRVRIDMEEYEISVIERFASPVWYRLGFAIFIKGTPKGGVGVPNYPDFPELPSDDSMFWLAINQYLEGR